MTIKSASGFLTLMLTATLCWNRPAMGAVQLSEDFDSTNNWGSFPFPASGYTNTATSATGWTISNALITAFAGAPSLSNACRIGGTGGQIVSALASNGVGSVIYYTAMVQANRTNSVVVEVGSGGGSWTVYGVTNTISSTSWTCLTNVVQLTGNQYVRLRKLNPFGSTSVFDPIFDSISITYPPAVVAITNVTISPSIPVENDSIAVTARLSVNGVPDTISVTNYWRTSPGSGWTAIPMVSNQPNVYITATDIPSQPVFTPIDYFVQAVQNSGGLISSTNSITNTVAIRPRSSYTNMVVTSPFNATLTLSSNYLWQGVAYVSNTASAFKFQGTSNGVNTLWGDSNQTLSNMLAFGNGEIGAGNIMLSTTNTGLHLFTFNETDFTYSARPCVRENFEAWSNLPFSTNTLQWTLLNGAVTNDAAGSLSGRYAILNSNTTSYLLSPLLTNGVGYISFWYRKSGSAGAPSGTLRVEVAPTPASSNWTTVTTLSNITSTTYAFANIPWADLNNQAVRILNNPDGGGARVSLDEVVVAAPAAAVYGANLTNTPAIPSSSDSVNIEVDLATNAWATLTNVVVWYRAATNLLYESIPMTVSNANHYVTTNGIPATLGTIQYAVEYRYSGILGQSPVFFPSSGTNQPYSYTTTDTVADYRYETFDSTNSWGSFPLPASGYTNVATNATGWIISNALITAFAAAPSQSNACRVGGTSGLISSPLLSNGVGSVVFYAAMAQANRSNQVIVEVSVGDGNWTAYGPTNMVGSTTFTPLTNTILHSSHRFIRLRKLNPFGSTSVFDVLFDNVYCTPYPANISVTNINLNPGYPAIGQSVMASCEVQSINPRYPAFNFTPTFYWSPYRGATNSIPMINSSGNSYTTIYPFVLTNITRDTPVTYWVRAAFAGYAAIPADSLSPKSSAANTFYVHAFSSSFSNIAAHVNGTNAAGRLLTNNLWQSIVTLSGTNGSFNLDLRGFGYSSGSGAQTNYVTWGNSNNWQSTLPLSDIAGTNQTSINLTGNFTGQYIVRFNELTGEYVVQQCVFQDFENWAGSGGKYVRSINANVPMVVNNFDNWNTNNTQVRFEDFSDVRWSNIINYTNAAAGGSVGYKIYGSKINSLNTNCVQTTNAPTYVLGERFVVQQSKDVSENDGPLRGIGTISYRYRAHSSSPAVTNAVYFFTNSVISDFNIYQYWSAPLTTIVTTATAFNTATITVKTNTTFPVIFSHNHGNQSMYFDDISVSEWYADNQTNSNWMTIEGYIEQRTGASDGNYCCRFETTRDDGSDGQYVISPMLSNGVNTVSFSYCGGTTNPTSFVLELKYGVSGTWTNLATITTNFNGTTSDYRSYSKTLMSSATNIFLRVRNTTAKPGALLLDDFKISGAAAGASWSINNSAIDDTDPSYPPVARQYYGGAVFLNNTNAGTDISTDTETSPYTNVWPNIYTPYLSFGVGEISFWYRNWITNGPVTPGRLRIQTSTTEVASTNNSDWLTVYTLDNITNTNDYQFFQHSLYDLTSRWVRIYNDNSATIGRVCLDDILVTAPIAATLSMSNMVVSPRFPLPTNTVHVTVDLYNLFLNPHVSSVTTLYGSAPTYAGLTSAVVSSKSMVCIASNAPGQRRWYRYQTSSPIPTNAVDNFVKYSVQVSFTGLNAIVTSPMTNRTFASYPTWYKPLDILYGTNQAYYIVYSCPTGTVWINEFMTDGQYESYRFVELCGKSGTSLSNWQVSIYNNQGTNLGSYVITTNATIANSTNGFGFWVVGDSTTSPRDMLLTNSIPQNGGFRIHRNVGVYEQAICYGQNSTIVQPLINAGFTYIGLYNFFLYDASVTLIGSNASGLSWANDIEYSYSPGYINAGEYLSSDVPQNIVPPSVEIVGLLIDLTNVWIECTSSNTWAPTPWYTTNLLNSNSWASITNYWTSYPDLTPSNTFTVHFNKSPVTPVFYKIVVTNTP